MLPDNKIIKTRLNKELKNYFSILLNFVVFIDEMVKIV